MHPFGALTCTGLGLPFLPAELRKRLGFRGMRTLRRVVTATAAAVLAFAAGTVAVSSPAQADGAAPGYFTGFDGGLYSTAIASVNPAWLDNGECLDLASSIDNRISSIVNSSFTTDWIVYKIDGCAPSTTSTVWHHSSGVMNSEWNNTIESIRRSWAN